jgi:hypothetical protein
VALFAVPTDFTRDLLIQTLRKRKRPQCSRDPEEDLSIREGIQVYINQLVTSLRESHKEDLGIEKIESCVDLRKLLARCKYLSKYEAGMMEDSGEFLNGLLSIFDSDLCQEKEYKAITRNVSDLKISDTGNVTNPEKLTFIPEDTQTFTNSSIIKITSSIILEKLNPKKTYYIVDFMTETNVIELENPKRYDGKNYSVLVSLRYITESPYLVFNLQRGANRNPILTKIVPLDVLFLNNPENSIDKLMFQLVAVVSWVDFHYTCFFLCNSTWMYYDDMKTSNPIKKIGGYKELLKAKPSVITNGTLHFYCRV